MPHGTKVPKVGFSRTKQRMWAAYMCAEKRREYTPQWVPDRDVYQCWLESVSADKGNEEAAPLASRNASSGVVLYDGNEAPIKGSRKRRGRGNLASLALFSYLRGSPALRSSVTAHRPEGCNSTAQES